MLQVETEAPDAERSGHATRALRSRPTLPPALAVCVCVGGGRCEPAWAPVLGLPLRVVCRPATRGGVGSSSRPGHTAPACAQL